MPPRHLDVEKFAESLVDRSRIVSGGPSADGIPPIDRPRFERADSVDWLQPVDPVMVVTVNGAVRAYPIQIMIWHEVVNDEIGGTPVLITYCPLCNSGLAFSRVVEDSVLDFGTSGALFQANLVMYDRQSESLWTQFDGRSVVGDLVGTQLDTLIATTLSWSDFLRDHPEADVLSRDTGNPRPYGRNPYNAYDQRESPVAGFYTGDADPTLPPYARVVGITTASGSLAVPTGDLAEVSVFDVAIGEDDLTVWHRPGTASALNDAVLAEGADVGATAVFHSTVNGERADFTPVAEGFVDSVSGTTWNILGEGLSGPLRDQRLEPVEHVDTFWFAWATFHVEAVVVSPQPQAT